MLFAPLLSSPALQGEPPAGTAPSISYPTPGLVIDYAEDDVAAVLTVLYDGDPAPALSLAGADAAMFDLSGDGVVWLSAPDYETPADEDFDNVYELTVVATNSEGTFAVDLAVRVTNVVDLAPTITYPTATPVQVPSGRVTAFTARSYDDASSRTWTITGGADADKFSIVGSTGRVSFLLAPDYAAPADFDADNDYELTIQVETTAGIDTQAVTVRVVEATGQPVLKPPVVSSIKSTWGGIG